MELSILDWIGYAASGIIAVSMTMNSIVKFRWVNLIGAGSFATYGLLIGAYPVLFLNGFIFFVDVYYLRRIYTKSQLFDILEVRGDNKYLLKFLEFHKEDIQKFFPGFEYKPELNTVSFFVMRNMIVSGLFLAHRTDDNILNVGLDYVIPEYRDYKNGKYVYHRLNDRFKQEGYQKVVANSSTSKHFKYLKKLGFAATKPGVFEKEI
ncbi:hypothetical protein N9934_00500 [Desulfosarcina sp.]|nr:hypothetical protein [Desulfosarcina sp.]